MYKYWNNHEANKSILNGEEFKHTARFSAYFLINKSAGMCTLRLAHWFMTNMNSQLSMFFQWTYHVEEG